MKKNLSEVELNKLIEDAAKHRKSVDRSIKYGKYRRHELALYKEKALAKGITVSKEEVMKRMASSSK